MPMNPPKPPPLCDCAWEGAAWAPADARVLTRSWAVVTEMPLIWPALLWGAARAGGWEAHMMGEACRMIRMRFGLDKGHALGMVMHQATGRTRG